MSCTAQPTESYLDLAPDLLPFSQIRLKGMCQVTSLHLRTHHCGVLREQPYLLSEDREFFVQRVTEHDRHLIGTYTHIARHSIDLCPCQPDTYETTT